jgi:single-stranded DNA-binding protein
VLRRTREDIPDANHQSTDAHRPYCLGETQKVTKVTVATNRDWIANGGKKSAVSYVPVSILDERQATWVAENVCVGDLVHVEARVEEGSYGHGEDKTYTVNVVAQEFNLMRRKGDASAEDRGQVQSGR